MKSFWKKWLPPVPLMLPAILSGALLAVSFPPVAWGALSFFALSPLLAALYRIRYDRNAFFKAGFLFGITFFLLMLWWIKQLLPWADVTIPWLMTPALIILVLYLSLFPAFFFLVLSFFGRGRWWPSFLIGPPLWVLFEIIRSRGELGFPWGVMGYALSYHTSLIQVTAVIGIYGLSFLVVLVNFIYVEALLPRPIWKRLVFVFLGLVIIAVNGWYGKNAVDHFSKDKVEKSIRMAVTQPNVDLKIKWNDAYTDSIFLLHERIARSAAALDPEIIIFPETSVPAYLRLEGNYFRRISQLAQSVGVPIFIGYLHARRDSSDHEMNIFNAAGLFSKEGKLIEHYDKVHLLPFGEALPLSSKYHFLRRINFGQGNFQHGIHRPPLRVRDTYFGPLICFESTFPERSRDYVREGAEVLVNITNDGWFGGTPGPVQHAQMCIMRAVENRRVLVRSANTGISMVVDVVGRVVTSIGVDREGVILEEIPLRTEQSFYTRHGDVPILLFSLLLVVAGVILARKF